MFGLGLAGVAAARIVRRETSRPAPLLCPALLPPNGSQPVAIKLSDAEIASTLGHFAAASAWLLTCAVSLRSYRVARSLGCRRGSARRRRPGRRALDAFSRRDAARCAGGIRGDRLRPAYGHGARQEGAVACSERDAAGDRGPHASRLMTHGRQAGCAGHPSRL